MVLPAYGTFDNFNPFIFKGIAATQVAALTMDSLAVVPDDDITTAYPLIAKKFELTDEYVALSLTNAPVLPTDRKLPPTMLFSVTAVWWKKARRSTKFIMPTWKGRKS